MIELTTVPKDLSEESLQIWLKDRVSEERYFHCLGTQQKATELAQQFKLPVEEHLKANVAGLLHDAAKAMTPQELLEACKLFEIPVTEDDRLSPQTLHPLVGAELVRFEFDIQDETLLNAMRYHTTGRAKMSTVEKIVFLADKIEGNTRNPLYIQKIHGIMESKDAATLDRVVLYILDSTMTFLIEKGQVIHPRTLEARNDLVRYGAFRKHPKRLR